MDRIFFPDGEIEREAVDPGKVERKVRAHGPKIMIVEVFFAAGGVGPAHAHAHDQATYCLSGEFDFTVAGETRRLSPGDSVFVPGGTTHGTACRSAGSLLDTFTPRREDFLKKE
jgi:quercetin dioxygenase-like cupin family protein